MTTAANLRIINTDPDNDPRYGCWHLLSLDNTILSIEWDVFNMHAFVSKLETQPEGFIDRLISYRKTLQPLYESRMLASRAQRSPTYCEVGKHDASPVDMYCIDFDVLCCREHYQELIDKLQNVGSAGVGSERTSSVETCNVAYIEHGQPSLFG